jgi:hypothetical protein
MTSIAGEVRKFPPLPSRVPVTLAEIEPAVYGVGEDGAVDRGTWRKTIVDPDTGHACFYVRFAPHQTGTPHWHPSDTLYLVVRGSLVIEGEGEYRAGDVRHVKGGFAYGTEGGGPEGCEFFFVSLGPYGRFDPDEHPPPIGRWDDPA